MADEIKPGQQAPAQDPAPTQVPAAVAPLPTGGTPAALTPASIAQPEEYAINLPKDVPVNEEMITAFKLLTKTPEFKANPAQAVVDFQAGMYRKDMAAFAEADKRNVAALKADAEFGGAKYEENMEIARKAALKFGDAALVERLKQTDPVLVKFLHKIGKASAEDNTPRSPAPTQEAPTADETNRARYPSMYNPDGSPKFSNP